MAIDLKLIDKLLADYKKPEDIIGENGLLKQLTKALLERAMQAEMTDHLGYEKHDPVGNNSGNSRNGKTTKTLKGDFGELPLETPRDRNGTLRAEDRRQRADPIHGFRRQDHLDVRAGNEHARDHGTPGRDLRSGGESDADLQRHRSGDGGGQDVAEPAAGCGLSDRVPGRVSGEDSRRRARSKSRRSTWRSASTCKGNKEVLGLWTGEAEGAKFWLQVLTDLKNRGVADIFIACVDGLKGFPKAIETVFPQAQVQLCIVHQVRASLNYVSWKQRKAVAADLQPIYRASTAEEADCTAGRVR